MAATDGLSGMGCWQGARHGGLDPQLGRRGRARSRGTRMGARRRARGDRSCRGVDRRGSAGLAEGL
eukprot:7765979-Lingulodinium_polyedra.AAC.1